MRLIYDIKVRYGRIARQETPGQLVFEPGFRYVWIPCISGIRDRKLSRYIHVFLMEKAVQGNRDLKPQARAFLMWVRWLETHGVGAFKPAILRYNSPSYGFREYLIGATERNEIASSTAAGYINVIRRFYEFLDCYGELNSGDFLNTTEKYIEGGRKVTSSDLTIRMVRTANRSLNPLNDVEQTILADALRQEAEPFRLMISLMKNSGLRLDEMLTLPSSLFREEHLSYTSSESGILRGIHIGPGSGVHTKFGITRELFVTRSLYTQVLDYLISDDYEKKISRWRRLYQEPQRYEPLFVMTNGKRMSDKAFYSRWYVFRKRLAGKMPGNVFGHKPHDLRATFATEFLRSALEHYPDQAANALGTVKYWMGHKSENTTMKYIVFLQQNRISDAVAGIMDAVLDDATAYEDMKYVCE